jgi:hypothetical protein
MLFSKIYFLRILGLQEITLLPYKLANPWDRTAVVTVPDFKP